MNVRMMPVVSLLVVFIASAPTLANAQHETEIVIQGPWILYQDNFITDQQGNSVRVLIAIAPADAIDYKDVGYTNSYKPSGMLHRPPQLSTGDGYYIIQRNIYCLAFAPSPTDGLQCAPTAPNASTSDTYPKEQTIKIPHKGAHWDWWTLAAGRERQTALILPMPDSISNDGTWPVKFASQFDENGQGYDYDKDSQNKDIKNHSTGVILHYQKGPNQFGLVKCSDAPAKGGPYFGVNDCVPPATAYPHRTDTHLENSGTLRIEMKSPYNVDGCDIHVRMGHRQMANLLKDFVGEHAFIEPAYYTNLNLGAIGFEDASKHPCFTKERKKLGSHPPFATAQEVLPISHVNMVAAKDPEQAFPSVTELDKLSGDFTTLSEHARDGLHINFLAPDPKYDTEDFILSEQGVLEAKEMLQSYNQDFPRISQITRIATLLQTAHEAIIRFRTHNALKFRLDTWFQVQRDLQRIISQLKVYNGPGKSAGDCLATPIQVLDKP